MVFVQATAVAMEDRAIMLTGPPGCGKSDLALRLMRFGAALIGDDGIDLAKGPPAGSRLWAAPLAGRSQRLHMAHIGHAAVPISGAKPAGLVVSLDPANLARERACAIGRYGPVDGLYLPQIALPALHPSSPDMLLLALERWGH